MESGWESDVKVHKGWDLCLCGGGGSCGGRVGGGSGVDGSDGGDGGSGVDGTGGNSGVGNGDDSGMYRSGGGGGSVVHGSVGGGLCRSGDAFVLGAVFVVEVEEGVELVVGCAVRRVVRLVLWCVNERGNFFALL